MKQKFKHIFHFIIVAVLSTLISNTILAEVVFEDKIELEEKEIEEEEEQEFYFDSCPQNAGNISIGAGGKVKKNVQSCNISQQNSIFISTLPIVLLGNNFNLVSTPTIAFYIRYCSLIVYS